MKKLIFTVLFVGGMCLLPETLPAQERLPEYLQAEKFTQSKLNTMLFPLRSIRTGFRKVIISGSNIRPAKVHFGMWLIRLLKQKAVVRS